MNSKKPLILVTNDDGYSSKGIKTLQNAMLELGDVIVFAPDKHQSGMSSAITLSHPIRVNKISDTENIKIYSCTGTPVDCVKLALNCILDRTPDLLVSGINHGSNAGINVVYSGTMGAAIEGCIFGIPSIGFSICDFNEDADFTSSAKIAKKIAKQVLQKGLPKETCLNINIPIGDIKEVRVSNQTKGRWINEYMKSKDGSNKDVFWMTGNFENAEFENDLSDEWALSNGYASIVPIKIDMTDYEFIKQFKSDIDALF